MKYLVPLGPTLVNAEEMRVEEACAGETEPLALLLLRYQDDLFRYIFTLLPHEEDARDVLQETSVALFRKWQEYDPSRPFLAWAFRFAYLEVLKHHERHARANRHLSRDVIDRLAQERASHEPVLHERLKVLEDCLRKLPGDDRQLIRLRYEEKLDVDALAQRLGTSRRSLFRELERIRRRLMSCVNTHMPMD